MTETVFGKRLFDMYFDFFVWPISHPASANMEGAGYMTYTDASHHGKIPANNVSHSNCCLMSDDIALNGINVC